MPIVILFLFLLHGIIRVLRAKVGQDITLDPKEIVTNLGRAVNFSCYPFLHGPSISSISFVDESGYLTLQGRLNVRFYKLKTNASLASANVTLINAQFSDSGKQIQCLLDGVRSNVGKISVYECPDLPSISGGQIQFSIENVTILAEYNCHGSVLKGNRLRTCRNNSNTWTGSTPTCANIIFLEPNEILGKLGRAVNFGCYQFQNNLSHLLLVDEDGFVIHEDHPSLSFSLEFYELKNNGTGLSANFTIIGAQFIDSGKRLQCLVEGKISNFGTLLVYECPDLPVFLNGQIETLVEPGFIVATYKCNEGYLLTGGNIRFCRNNTVFWSGIIPQCAVFFNCGEVPLIRNGHLQYLRKNLEATYLGGVVVYNCTDEYYLVGSHRRRCNEGGKWSGIEPYCAKCVQYNCTYGYHLLDPQITQLMLSCLV